MHDVDLSAIDLNLLVALEALLAEQSVTRAAARLGVGQPAASHALGRLRRLFDDPLLVRVGRGMAPTPLGEALGEPLARWLAEARHLIAGAGAFEPAETTRRFVLAAPDLLAPIVPRLSARLAAEAPRASLEVRSRRGAGAEGLAGGEADVTLTGALDAGPGLMRRGLGELHFAVVGRRDHPALARRRLGRKAWAAHPHVVVCTGHEGSSVVARALDAAGFERRVGLIVPGFLAALVVVAETDALFCVPRELAAPLLERLGLVARRPPVPTPAVPVVALWHERVHAAPAHRFFRRLVQEEVQAALGARSSR